MMRRGCKKWDKAYNVWASVKRRCFDPKAKQYTDYGGRGITLQPDWVSNSAAFCEYILNLPGFSEHLTIDRIDNDLGYFEGNLRWASRGRQAKNRRKYISNKSGTTGVGFYGVDRGSYVDTYVIVHWKEGREFRSKSFNVAKHGLLPAFAKGVLHRKAMIDKLVSAGVQYSDKHGL